MPWIPTHSSENCFHNVFITWCPSPPVTTWKWAVTDTRLKAAEACWEGEPRFIFCLRLRWAQFNFWEIHSNRRCSRCYTTNNTNNCFDSCCNCNTNNIDLIQKPFGKHNLTALSYEQLEMEVHQLQLNLARLPQGALASAPVFISCPLAMCLLGWGLGQSWLSLPPAGFL